MCTLVCFNPCLSVWGIHRENLSSSVVSESDVQIRVQKDEAQVKMWQDNVDFSQNIECEEIR